ncbi:hypothetical protein BELL_0599g00020 [Botrytis elliptica]|uniref:FAD-binding domain-containing protein n=1 Tax=Botrytis elliptica TaxID=278938 RepID=A0A4Z1JC53_9HELO|nr:hypothetical protein EAE99_005763 [Botrytis elliptica]TGO71265.1 hypothetical protein BELL_0599g00020 [Botrytis elliptica]
MTDHIWGVVCFITDIMLPYLRKRHAIHSDAGSVMIIPRERISTGQYLTRLYVQIKTKFLWKAPIPAAYQIGRRMTPHFSISDDAERSRALIVGDACHTHSQKAGQGMNVFLMDSYLAWKLAHEIYALSPGLPGASVLKIYKSELVTFARMLIEFDNKFSSIFSGQIGSDSSIEGLSHEQFLKVSSDGSGFTSVCRIEYPQSIIAKAISTEN